MNKLNELLNNESVNVFKLFNTTTGNTNEMQEIVKTASSADLKKLIVKFDENQAFDFMEDFIIGGNAENMSEEEYWSFIDEAGL